MENTEYENYLQSERWKAIARKRVELDENRCVMCGSRGTTGNPLEVHHLKYTYIGEEEPRIWQDLATLCHMCHKQVHALMCRRTAPDRFGWKSSYNIPAVSVYTLTGKTLECREVGLLHEEPKRNNTEK